MDSTLTKLEKDIISLLTSSPLGILSQKDQLLLNQLRSKRLELQTHFLLTWQLKSCTNWAQYGDSNTKKIHTVASRRRNQNTIWSLEDEDGHCIEDESALKNLGHKHFSHIFCDDKSTYFISQL